jgi:hypothetical protein
MAARVAGLPAVAAGWAGSAELARVISRLARGRASRQPRAAKTWRSSAGLAAAIRAGVQPFSQQPDHHPAGLGVEGVAEHRGDPGLLVGGREPRPPAVHQRPGLLPQPAAGIDQVLAARPQRAQRAGWRAISVHRGSLPAGEQLTDRGRIQPVGLAPPVALLLAHRRHLSGVEQPYHQLPAII